MGRLLFVQTRRSLVIVGFVFAGLCGFGGLWFLFGDERVPGLSFWSYNLPLGLVLLGAAASLSRLGTRQWSHRTELYEHGFINTARDQRIIAKYSELRSLAVSVTDMGQSQTRMTVLAFQTNRGEIVRVVNQVGIGVEDVAMEAVWAAASIDLAQRWRERLQTKIPVDWLVDRQGRPLVQILSTGVQARARADDAFEYAALVELEYELWQGRFTLKKAGRKLVTVDSASPNVYPGLTLLEQLDEERKI